MENDFEELKPIIDQLIILVHIKTLTSAIHELVAHTFDEQDAKDFLKGLYDTLAEKTLSQLSEISESLYTPAKAHFQALEFQSYIRHVRDNLELS